MMHKLRLDLDALAVETFAPTAAGDARPGTIQAHDAEPTPVIRTLPLSNCVYSACATCGIYC
ncbi:MAG: hypothetical protein JO306_02290 [Gemmatimonadetes bacterium]|nr:hypothetical protein [Gemmatimonadota bacterium]